MFLLFLLWCWWCLVGWIVGAYESLGRYLFLHHVAQAMGAGSNLGLTILMRFEVPYSHSLWISHLGCTSCHSGQLDSYSNDVRAPEFAVLYMVQ
jgi:hypothetical protein